MIDDIVGVTEAGINAQKMNSFINLKTAEKSPRFGASKCKSMVIRKNCDICSEELNDKSTMRRHSESHHRGKWAGLYLNIVTLSAEDYAQARSWQSFMGCWLPTVSPGQPLATLGWDCLT